MSVGISPSASAPMLDGPDQLPPRSWDTGSGQSWDNSVAAVRHGTAFPQLCVRAH